MLRVVGLYFAAVSYAASPEDKHPECGNWAKRGECDRNPKYMHANCERSCKVERKKMVHEQRRLSSILQTEEQQAAGVERLRACSGAAAAPDEEQLRKAVDSCRQYCDEHTDCASQCKDLSPRELHGYLQSCAPWPHLSSEAVSTGLHVICLVRSQTCDDIYGHAVVFRDARVAVRPQVHSIPSNITTLAEFVAHAEDRVVFKRKRGKLYQRSGFFTPRGNRVLQLSSALEAPSLFMFEGGQWIWPSVRVNHTVELPDLRNTGEVTRITTVSLVPAVFEIENFLKTEESERIMHKVSKTIMKSPVAMKDADKAKGKAAKEFRTSSQEFLSTEGDPLLQAVDERVQQLTKVPITHAEHIQVLRYNYMEHYSAHHDFFDPHDYAKDRNILNLIQEGATNRMATVFFYLTNVTRGGQTNFPMAGGRSSPRDFFDCSQGYSSWPVANKVIIFYSMLPDGSMDKNALHGGCDVLEGQKWSANFWLWNKPQHSNEGHSKRREIARMLGAVGSPGRREVVYLEEAADKPEL